MSWKSTQEKMIAFGYQFDYFFFGLVQSEKKKNLFASYVKAFHSLDDIRPDLDIPYHW
jgi:hypothetical protein